MIDSLEVEFPEGLVIITGQTGAGKSILLGALSLASGGKADASFISEGADSCVVEAVYESQDPQIRQILDSNDIEWLDGEITVRRQIASSGRSRAFVNDSPVTVGVLQELASRLVDIHSQHCSLLLADAGFQLGVLDAFARNGELLQRSAQLWAELRRTARELAEMQASRDAMLSEAEYKRSQYLQLEQAKLSEGELASLEEEQKRLANAEEIKSYLAAMSARFEGDGESVMGIDAALREIKRELEKLSRFVGAASELAERIDSARLELEDIAADLSSIDEGIEDSPSRLEYVEDRMSLLYDLMRRHGVSDIESLIAIRDGLSDSLLDAESISERIEEAKKRKEELYSEYRRVAEQLHDRRYKAAEQMSERISQSLHFLELETAVFEVVVSAGEESATGADAVSFLFSSNTNAPKDIRYCASGGEMSRIMLCIKALMAKFAAMPTLVFDEIDTGVSGSVADKMGQMICAMGADMQVFAITHLPQVAAKGEAHYLVSKSRSQNGRSVSTISELDSEGRVMEIARMLSGSEISDAAIANARDLLS